jgi:NitT/TauT family transport system substrate-binding protein
MFLRQNLATREQVIQERRTELQAYLRAVDKAVKLVNAGDAEAISITAQKLGVSPDEARAQIAGIRIFDIEMNKSLAFNQSDPNNVFKNYELNIATGKDMKILTKEIKVESLYDDSIVKSLQALRKQFLLREILKLKWFEHFDF